ncbi:MAG: cellulase family glycosylhydrolase [Deferribacteres bacterium]|nr:cellulase family glycosylhydrolase [candidate division KSB1 bacterium]MCB9502180.1 cellulase family glycosylhydrolase [Deferribacteres bacterium]
MNSRTTFIIIVSLSFFFIRCNGQPQFVKVDGTHFTIGGKPYHFLGTNLWYGANLGALTEGGNQERLVKELDLLKSIGINNLRVLGASEGQTQSNTVNPPMQPELGQYNENVLQGLDFLLAEMEKRNMYAVVYLNNFWIWSGGMAQYGAWTKGVPLPNPFFEEYTWHDFMNFSAGFYTNPEANEYYRIYLKMLINRKNTVTGVRYKDDPTIMSWQLANEPRPGEGEQGKRNFTVFGNWIDETASYIKSLDVNHLVSTGNEGLAGAMWSDSLYKRIHSYEQIDYLTFHLWLLNWTWFDPIKAEETYPEGAQKASGYIEAHIGYAREVGKPLVLEEFGLPRDGHIYSPKASTKYRDQYFDLVFSKIVENARNGGPLAGSNFWTWGGFGKARDPQNAVWKQGDDFTGDPPQEPQGRNSVFVTDSSTVEVLKKYAGLMNEIKVKKNAQ